jgi:RimJ/RimL family protein N-acetyltransferase
METLGNVIEAEPMPVEAPIGREEPALWQGGVIAQGKRVALRTLTPADLDHLSDWTDDPFIERMVGSELLYTYKHVYDKDASFYEACLTDPTQVVMMIEARGGWTKPVGLVRLYNIHVAEGYAFLETMITDPRALRKGLGVEASQLIAYYGVDVLGLRRIEAKVYEYNLLSINSLRKHGFQQEGVLRKACAKGGRYWDVIVFGILKEEIEEQRKKDKLYFPFDGTEGDTSEPT